MFQVVTVDEAKEMIAAHWRPHRKTEQAPMTCALGRVLAAPVTSQCDVPGFDRSTVDGFAVAAAGTFGASEGQPAYLEVVGEVTMGRAPELVLGSGQTVGVATGGMIPPGADAVVMLEHTEWMGPASLCVHRPVAPGENVVRRGEDVAAGEQVLTANHRLRPQDLGMLAAVGMEQVEVYQPWRVGIISTGNEVVPPGAVIGGGQIRDVNSYTLHAMVTDSGNVPILHGIVPDDFVALRAVVDGALAGSEIILLSGGSSVGTRDYTVEVLNSLGDGGILFHGLSLRPGKPTITACVRDRLVFGLPGHPVSAMVVFDLLVRPLLVHGDYSGPTGGRVAWARLTRNLASGAGREDHVRVRLREVGTELLAEPVLGKSGLISTMVQADGEVVIPLEREGLAAGTPVRVHLF